MVRARVIMIADSFMSNSDQTERSTGPREIKREDELHRIINRHRRVLVEFYADWCMPCRDMKPMVRDVAQEAANPVLSIDVEAAAPIAAKHDVDAVPTFLLFQNGELIERLTGIQQKTTLTTLLAD
ncbi:MAG: thioredoxin family protein [Halobacteriales archaeon]